MYVCLFNCKLEFFVTISGILKSVQNLFFIDFCEFEKIDEYFQQINIWLDNCMFPIYKMLWDFDECQKNTYFKEDNFPPAIFQLITKIDLKIKQYLT